MQRKTIAKKDEFANGYKDGLNANKRQVVSSVMVQTLDTKDLTCNEKEAKKSDRMPDNRKVENWKKKRVIPQLTNVNLLHKKSNCAVLFDQNLALKNR